MREVILALKNKLVVFEGLDGAGKSTLIKLFKEELLQRHQNVTVTREPGGTELGEELRQIILRRDKEAPSPRTELLLYEAIRAQHVEKLIRPKLNQGEWVLCDRFSASSIAFQAGGRKIAEEDVKWLNSFATDNLTAGVTILLDLTYDEAKQRQAHRFESKGEMADRMEAEARDFHERVRDSFLKQAQEAKDISSQNSIHFSPSKDESSERHSKNSFSQWIVLSAMQSPESLLSSLIQKLKEQGLWEF